MSTCVSSNASWPASNPGSLPEWCVAWRDTWALNPNPQLAVARHKLQRDARHRQADSARASDIGVAARRDHSTLGSALLTGCWSSAPEARERSTAAAAFSTVPDHIKATQKA